MPDQFDVHGRSKWEWGQDGRSKQVAASIDDQIADPAPRKPEPDRKYKDMSRCKHSPDKHHHYVFVLRRAYPFDHLCEWMIAWYKKNEPVVWNCKHQESCEHCGKILLWQVTIDRCPDYPGCEEQKAAVYEEYERRKAAQAERSMTWQQRRTLIKSQKTGYRRPKGGKK